MKLVPKTRGFAFAVIATGALATAALAQTPGLFLVVHGTVASSDVRIVNGHAYVPLRDVAKAYEQTLVKRPGGYELIDSANPGAATPSASVTSQVPQPAAWSVTVTGVDQVLSYHLRYNPSGATVAPVHADDGLVVVNCRVANGSASAQTLGIGSGISTLTDDQGIVHKALAYDVRPARTIGALRGVAVPANGATDIAVVFSISQESSPKTFRFTLSSLTGSHLDTAHQETVNLPLQ